MSVSTIMPKAKKHLFSRVPKNESVVYSTFDRSHRYLSAFDEDVCIPIFIDEVYPGDIFNLNARHLTRLLTPVHPFMDRLSFDVVYGYCPTRLIWSDFKAFMGERKRLDESLSDTYQVPMLNSGAGVAVGSIFDYAGIPTGVANLDFSALPFRALNLFYNEWLRDENLCDWLNVGGVDDASGDFDLSTEFGSSDQLKNYSLFKRAKRHDYFTSALPFQQKGAPISIRLGDSAPVIGNGISLGLTNGTDTCGLNTIAGAYLNNATNAYGADISNTPVSGSVPVGVFGVTSDKDKSGLIADLTNVPAFSVSDFRTAMQLQALLELHARSGTRYKEIIKGEFDVTVSDATLDRPEYLGGYSVDFSTIPVASTVGNDDNPQGNLSAFSVTDTSTRHCFDKAFEEHGYIFALACVRGEQSYQQGLQRFWSRKNKYDFYTPMLANLSEQAIKMKEILAQGASVVDSDGNPVDEKTFGYQEAWAELRYKPNLITGKMRSTDPNTLDVWHLAPKFEPTIDSETNENLGIPLNSDFINSDTPVERVLAVQDEPHFFSDNWFDLKCTRELPIYSVPSYLIGRL